MKRIAIAFAAALPFAAISADLNCSIKAKSSLTKSEYTPMAKIDDAAARKAATDKIGVAGASIGKGGLEVEDGCLVYTYDIKVPGKGGYQEVIVDAGNGSVLAVEHESAAKEAAEKAADKMKPGKS